MKQQVIQLSLKEMQEDISRHLQSKVLETSLNMILSGLYSTNPLNNISYVYSKFKKGRDAKKWLLIIKLFKNNYSVRGWTTARCRCRKSLQKSFRCFNLGYLNLQVFDIIFEYFLIYPHIFNLNVFTTQTMLTCFCMFLWKDDNITSVGFPIFSSILQ